MTGDLIEQTEQLQRHVTILLDWVWGDDTLRALRHVATVNRQLGDIAGDLCEKGAREGLSQRALADALEIPASTLRGLKASVQA